MHVETFCYLILQELCWASSDGKHTDTYFIVSAFMSNLYNIYVVKTGATAGIFAIGVHVDWTQMAIFAILLQNTANICLSILKVDIFVI